MGTSAEVLYQLVMTGLYNHCLLADTSQECREMGLRLEDKPPPQPVTIISLYLEVTLKGHQSLQTVP